MIDVGWVVLLVAGIALVLIVLPVALSASQVRRGSFFRMAESCGPWLGGVAMALLILLAVFEAFRGDPSSAVRHVVFAVIVGFALRTGLRRAAEPPAADTGPGPPPTP